MITLFKKSSAKCSITALIIILLLTGCSSLTNSGKAQNSADTSAAITAQSQNDSATASSQNSSGDNSILSKTNEEAAIEAYKLVLQNKAEYYSTDNKKDLYLKDFLANQELYKVNFEIANYAVLDMDGDNIPEVVLELTANGFPEFYEILHYTDGKIYGYIQVSRGLKQLKTDGTFLYSSGAFDNGYGKMIFNLDSFNTEILGYVKPNQDSTAILSYLINNNPVSEAEYNSFKDTQTGKTDVDWYKFSQENISTIKTAENVAAQPISVTRSDIQDSIIYIAGISSSLRGIDRYSFTENGEIISGSSYNFDTNCRYYNTDQTELNFNEFASIAYKKYSTGAFVKCNIKSLGKLVKEAYLID